MLYEIKSWITGEVLFALESASLKITVEAAVKAKTNLRDADLRDANLRGANLRGSNLRGSDLRDTDLRDADLRDADLRDADLRVANLRDANLRDANLRGSDLCDANLRGSDLRDANLRDADLCDANLRGSDLRGSDLCDANLTPIRDDLWAVLSSSPKEVASLRQSLIDGKIDGSTYEGDCACLVGSLANARHCNFTSIPGLAPNSSRPAERFFLSIGPGDTPDNSQFAKLALEWIDTWLDNVTKAFETAK